MEKTTKITEKGFKYKTPDHLSDPIMPPWVDNTDQSLD
jgi:hypothetical protein